MLLRHRSFEDTSDAVPIEVAFAVADYEASRYGVLLMLKR